jgi:hypothetical protein
MNHGQRHLDVKRRVANVVPYSLHRSHLVKFLLLLH